MMGVVGVVFLLFLQYRWEYLLELSGEFPYRRMPEGESDKARKAAKEEKRPRNRRRKKRSARREKPGKQKSSGFAKWKRKEWKKPRAAISG